MDPKTFAYHKITVVHALFTFAIVLIDPVFAIYLNQLGFEPIWIGVILSSFSLATIFVAPLIGGISDTWGRRPLILVGIFLAIVSFGIYTWVDHPMALFIARIVEAIAYASVAFISIAKLEDLVTDQQKKLSEKVGMSLSIGKIGFVLGPLVGGYVAMKFGIEFPFILGIFILAGVWLIYFIMPHRVHPRAPLALSFNPLPAMREFLAVKPFQGLSMLVMIHQYTIPVLYIFVPLFVIHRFDLGLEEVGVALFVRELPQLIQFWGGKLTDSWGSTHVMILGTALSGVGLIGAGLSQSFDWFLVSMFAYGFGSMLLGISSLALISGIAEEMKREGTFLGTMVSISKIGAFVGFLTAGIFVQLTDIPTLFIATGTLLLLGIIATEEGLGPESFPIPKPAQLIQGLFRPR